MTTLFESTLEAPEPASPWQEQPFANTNRFGVSEALTNSPSTQQGTSPFPKFGRAIIGNSPSLKEVLHLASVVAPTDSTVLILGETGTGKELVAQAVNELSSRRNKPFVKLNCAALPAGLLESELFGYERGAFTGAVARKAGRFEMANQGTLFLDEVGDIPLELQPKLLRALQEQEFERLGSTITTRVNVRIVAATSRDLSQMVRDRQFRSDLYYRLNVFPIRVPPLRERLQDIPLLVHHFVGQFERAMNKRIDTIPVEVMKALALHSWPGNIRELQNFIERAVILSRGGVLTPLLEDLSALHSAVPAIADRVATTAHTLKDIEREHILFALRDADWVVSGPAGAAARLGLKRTTLNAKMLKLGIHRPTRRSESERLKQFGDADEEVSTTKISFGADHGLTVENAPEFIGKRAYQLFELRDRQPGHELDD